jgi:hypothetical protein
MASNFKRKIESHITIAQDFTEAARPFQAITLVAGINENDNIIIAQCTDLPRHITLQKLSEQVNKETILRLQLQFPALCKLTKYSQAPDLCGQRAGPRRIASAPSAFVQLWQ